MWTQEIINVVVENKNRGTFIEKTAWSDDGMNVIVQLRGSFNWGALDLTPAQYEAIEETSHDPDTYDSVYNSGSRYEIKDFQASLFLDGLLFPGRRILRTGGSVRESLHYRTTRPWRRCRTTIGLRRLMISPGTMSPNYMRPCRRTAGTRGACMRSRAISKSCVRVSTDVFSDTRG